MDREAVVIHVCGKTAYSIMQHVLLHIGKGGMPFHLIQACNSSESYVVICRCSLWYAIKLLHKSTIKFILL